jgi:hypothetical protein
VYFKIQVHNLLSEILKTEKLQKPKVFIGGLLQPKYDGHHDNDDEIDVPSSPGSQARCNVPLLHIYVQVYSLVWACLCLKFYWMFYLEIKKVS